MLRITRLQALARASPTLVRAPAVSNLVHWYGVRIPSKATVKLDPVGEDQAAAALILGDVVLRRPDSEDRPLRATANGVSFARLTSGPLESSNPSDRSTLVVLAIAQQVEPGAPTPHDEIVSLTTAQRIEIPEERIAGQLLPGSQRFSAAVGIVPPHGSQRHHQQIRPQNGIESILVFSGRFRVKGAQPTEEFSANDYPVLVEVPSHVPASFENTGGAELRFLTVFSPPFKPGEIHWLEPN